MYEERCSQAHLHLFTGVDNPHSLYVSVHGQQREGRGGEGGRERERKHERNRTQAKV